MSQNDELKIENKTIRIPAHVYYKAVELTGLLTVIAGHNYSLSEIVSDIIGLYHTEMYPRLAECIQDEKKRAEMKATLQKSLQIRSEIDPNLRIRK